MDGPHLAGAGLRVPLGALVSLVALLCLLAPGVAGAQGVSTRVYHGSDARDGEYPWTVALVVAGYPASQGQFCGGTLVRPTRVVTAAHCTIGSRPQDIEVLAGATDLADADEADYRKVSSISLHPQAVVDDENGEVRYDVSLLELAEPVTDVPAIPIVDPLEFVWPLGTELKLTGWGETHLGLPSRLQHATLDAVADADCALAWGAWFSSDDMLCALRVSGSTTIDACNGDSGGPLTTIPADPDPDATDPTGWTLVGAVSWGSAACDDPDHPGVYARLGASALHAYATAEDPEPQPAWTAGTVTLTGTPQVGEEVACTASEDLAFTPADADVTLRIRTLDEEGLPSTVATGTPDGPLTYLVADDDIGHDLVCEAIAEKDGAGGYGLRTSEHLGPVQAAPGDDGSGGGSNGSGSTGGATGGTGGSTGGGSGNPASGANGGDGRPNGSGGSGGSGGTGGSGGSGGSRGGTGTQTTPRRDAAAPQITRVRFTCRRRRCTLTITVADPKPTSGIARVHVTVSRTVARRCTRKGRRTTCRRTITRTLKAVRRKGSTRIYTVRTPALARGRHVVMMRAVDRAGNIQRLPTRRALQIR